MDRAELRAALVEGRRRLDAVLARYDDAAMLDRIDGEWTRKDVVAHLEAWERRVVELLDALRGGGSIDSDVDTDERNARFFARDRGRSLEDVRTGERAAYEAMLAAIDGASDEELFDGRHFAWTEGDPLASWYRGNGDEHIDEHLEQLSRPAIDR